MSAVSQTYPTLLSSKLGGTTKGCCQQWSRGYQHLAGGDMAGFVRSWHPPLPATSSASLLSSLTLCSYTISTMHGSRWGNSSSSKLRGSPWAVAWHLHWQGWCLCIWMCSIAWLPATQLLQTCVQHCFSECKQSSRNSILFGARGACFCFAFAVASARFC